MTLTRALYGRKELHRLIEPRSIAVVGASPTEGSFGRRTLENLENFQGAVYGINPKYDEILGRPTYPSLSALPEVPDCVVVCVGRHLVEGVIEEATSLGIGGAVVYASGYRETGEAEGQAAQQWLLESAQRSDLRIAGPNCIGLVNAHSKAAMNFMTECGPLIAGAAGTISLVSQSGALGYALLQGVHRGMSFSKFLACGNSVDIDVADYVSYLADDPDTSVIVCVLEGVEDGTRFIDAIRKSGRAGKPVIVYKAADGEISGQAAMSHTGTIAGSADAYRAAFEQSGAILVRDFEALMEVASFFAKNPDGPVSDGVGIMATSGGAGVICADKAEENALALPALAPATTEVLEATLPGFGSSANPADLTAEVLKDSSTFKTCLTAFCEDSGFGAVVVPLTFAHEKTTGVRVPYLTEVAKQTPTALAAVWMNEWLEGPGSRELDSDEAVTIFRSPARCMWTIQQWMKWHARTNWESPTHPSEETTHQPAIDHLLPVRGEAPVALTESAAKEIVSHYGISVPAEKIVHTPEEAATVAAAMGFPVVLKVVSPDILHKTEVGGVRINLTTTKDVREALTAMQTRLSNDAPDARIEGYSVQQMATDGPEILLGARYDPVFGPLVLLGTGGTWVEILKDVQVYLTPIDHTAAAKAVAEMTLSPVFAGARGEAPYDTDAIADCIVAFSRLVRDLNGKALEVELNPVRITRDRGPIAVDALIVLSGNNNDNPSPKLTDTALSTNLEGAPQWANV